MTVFRIPIPLPEILRPLRGRDVAYVEAVRDVLIDAPTTLERWWTDQCPECGHTVPADAPETEEEAIHAFRAAHFVVNGHVVIGCEGLRVVNPNVVGIWAPDWLDWHEPAGPATQDDDDGPKFGEDARRYGLCH
jgi:hypothetical protein